MSKITIYGGISSLDESEIVDLDHTHTLPDSQGIHNYPDFSQAAEFRVDGITYSLQKSIQIKIGQVIQIACGQSHFLVLCSDGSVFSFGSNQFGQNGTNMRNRDCFVKIRLPQPIFQISAGLYHSVALAKDCVYVWGRGSEGQLGLGNNECYDEPQELNSKQLLFYKFFQKKKVSDIQSSVCGSFHTLLLSKNNEVYGMGENANGQLGIGQGEGNIPVLVNIGKPIVQIAAGLDHSLFLDKFGQVKKLNIILKKQIKLYVCGNNLFGQCGIEGVQTLMKPQALNVDNIERIFASMGTFSGVLTKDHKIWIWGTGSWGYARRPVLLEDISRLSRDDRFIDILMGENFAIVKKENGEFYGLGQNRQAGETQFGSQSGRADADCLDLPNVCCIAGYNVVVALQQIEFSQQQSNRPHVNESTQQQRQLVYEPYQQQSNRPSYAFEQIQNNRALEQSNRPHANESPQQYNNNRVLEQSNRPYANESPQQHNRAHVYESTQQQNNNKYAQDQSRQSSIYEQQERARLYSKPPQKEYSRNMSVDKRLPQSDQKSKQQCFECSHMFSTLELSQRQLRTANDENQSLKKELEFCKQQMKQKDQFIVDLENRIVKYQDYQITKSIIKIDPHQQKQVNVSPIGRRIQFSPETQKEWQPETRMRRLEEDKYSLSKCYLKSIRSITPIENNNTNESILIIQSKIMENSPQKFPAKREYNRDLLINKQSIRAFERPSSEIKKVNTSIIEKIQNFQHVLSILMENNKFIFQESQNKQQPINNNRISAEWMRYTESADIQKQENVQQGRMSQQEYKVSPFVAKASAENNVNIYRPSSQYSSVMNDYYKVRA